MAHASNTKAWARKTASRSKVAKWYRALERREERNGGREEEGVKEEGERETKVNYKGTM